jgi:myosin-1
VVTLAKDGRNETTLERKIPLVTITSIGMSSLRDDWMVSSVRRSWVQLFKDRQSA